MKLRVAAPLLLLCACEQKPGNTVSVSDGQAVPGSPLQPGQWKLTTDMSALEPNKPPETREICLSTIQAAQPGLEVFSGWANMDQCKRETWDVAGGNINASVVCAGVDDIKSVPTKLWGSYGPTSFSVTIEQHVFGMTVPTHVRGERLGACP